MITGINNTDTDERSSWFSEHTPVGVLTGLVPGVFAADVTLGQ